MRPGSLPCAPACGCRGWARSTDVGVGARRGRSGRVLRCFVRRSGRGVRRWAGWLPSRRSPRSCSTRSRPNGHRQRRAQHLPPGRRRAGRRGLRRPGRRPRALPARPARKPADRRARARGDCGSHPAAQAHTEALTARGRHPVAASRIPDQALLKLPSLLPPGKQSWPPSVASPCWQRSSPRYPGGRR